MCSAGGSGEVGCHAGPLNGRCCACCWRWLAWSRDARRRGAAASPRRLCRACGSPDNPMYGPDAELGWSLVPNSSAQLMSGNRTISVEVNSLGLREREFNDTRPGTFIFIGDFFHLRLRRRAQRALFRSPAAGAAALPHGQCRGLRVRDRPAVSTTATAVEPRRTASRRLDHLRR